MIIKSIFIGVYPVLSSLLMLFTLMEIGQAPPILTIFLALFFTLLAVMPFPLFLGYLFLKKEARTSKNLSLLYGLPLLSFIVLLVLSWICDEEMPNFLLNLGMTATALIGNLLYIFWYSVFNRKANILLEVGKSLPQFSLKDSLGNNISSKDIGAQSSLIMFYRGNWCPLCMAQIKEVASHYRELEARGIKTYMVSPQPEKHTKDLAKQFDVNMNFLVDVDNQVADKLQIKAKNGLPMGLQALGYDSDTVMPTVILTDKTGKIIFADLTDNYRVRPEPEDFLRVFDSQ